MFQTTLFRKVVLLIGATIKATQALYQAAIAANFSGLAALLLGWRDKSLTAKDFELRNK